MDAIKAFAGPKPERAVVDPGARAVLSEFDDLHATTKCFRCSAQGLMMSIDELANYVGATLSGQITHQSVTFGELTISVAPERWSPFSPPCATTPNASSSS